MTSIPTITQLYTAIKADLAASYGDPIPLFGKIFLRALAMVQAGKLKLFYLALGNVQKNIFIDTADPEAVGGTLERFGRIKLGRNPFPATPGQYVIQVTGSIGATIKASTTFKSNDDSLNPSILYVLDTTYILVATTDSITVRALTAGVDGKLSINDGLTATAPIANVNAAAIVLSETIEPLAAEGIEDYRSKGEEAFRLEPQGGAPSDFRLWSKDAQGVQEAYPYAKSGYSGEVNLYIEATTADSTDGKGTPSAALLTAVEAVVELDPDTTKPLSERGRRPLGVFDVNYLPVIPKDINIQISGFVGITNDIKTLILNAITEALTVVRPFVGGADVLADKRDTFSVNDIISIILTVRPGSVFGTVTMTVGGTPASTFTFSYGDIPYMNSITYV